MKKHFNYWWPAYCTVLFVLGIGVFTYNNICEGDYANTCTQRCESKHLYYENSDKDLKECICREARVQPKLHKLK